MLLMLVGVAGCLGSSHREMFGLVLVPVPTVMKLLSTRWCVYIDQLVSQTA